MNPPKIFISATSGDLSSARQIAKEALLTINCHPVEQTNFEPDWRSVTDMLRGKIGDCQALIHLVGFRYGAEPDPASLPDGTPRRSYTQMEYHLARELGLRVYTFLLPETYPFDVPEKADTPEQTQLQAAHRALIKIEHCYEDPANDIDLRTRIIALQEQVISLVQEQQSIAKEVKTSRHWGIWTAAAILLVLGGIGLGIHYVTSQNTEVSAAVAKVQSDVTEVKAVFTKERKFMSLILARANERLKDWENMKPAERFDLALDQIAAEQKIPSKELRDLLDLYVQRVEIDSDAAAEDKFFVLMRKQAFNEAAQLANNEGHSAEVRMKQQASRRDAAQAIAARADKQEKLERQRAIDFYQKEGNAYESAVQFEEALSAYQKAAALVDKIADPIAWAGAQGWVAPILDDLARYKEAELLIREILRLREQHLGATHKDTAVALNDLSHLLIQTNRLEEAVPMMQRVVMIDEANFGPDHSAVATGLNNLGETLRLINRLTDAEPMFRRALKIDEACLGRDHPDVARDLNNLASLLQATDRFTEAEALMQRVVTILENKGGEPSPNYATALNNLAQVLKATNRLTEAEPLLRRALKIDEAAFGPDHPDVSSDLNNLALLCQKMGRLEEAELLSRRMVAIFVTLRRSTGHEHTNLRAALENYSDILAALKLSEEQIHTKLLNVLGPDLASTILGSFQVTITEVVKGRQGEALGLQPGDAFVSYNGQVVSSVEQFIWLTSEAKGKTIAMEVLRDGKKLNFTATPGKLGTRIENRPLPPANGTKPSK